MIINAIMWINTMKSESKWKRSSRMLEDDKNLPVEDYEGEKMGGWFCLILASLILILLESRFLP